MLHDAPGEGFHITGEVWEVDGDTLGRLDVLERVGCVDGYVRRRVMVEGMHEEGDGGVWCWLKGGCWWEVVENGGVVLGEYRDRRYKRRGELERERLEKEREREGLREREGVLVGRSSMEVQVRA